MKRTVTVRLDADLHRLLEQVCRGSRLKRSDVVRDALRRQLALLRFEQLRRKTMPFAEARGYLMDEDVELCSVADVFSQLDRRERRSGGSP